MRCPWETCHYVATSNVDLGYHLIDGKDAPEHTANRPSLRPVAPGHPRPRRIAAHLMPVADDLFPGVVVLRHTTRASATDVRTEIPCCPRDRVARIAARGVRLAVGTVDGFAVCPSCGWLWAVSLDDEGGEDYTAYFVLVERVAVAAGRRSYARAL